MILLDLSQIMISNIMMQMATSKTTTIDENLVRHMVLNSFRLYRRKFTAQYGELIVCCDDKNFWRKNVFPHYKANRKRSRDASAHDWNGIFQTLGNIKQEIKDNLPYKTLQVETAEADDIIATLVHANGQFLAGGEPILILSGDKDFGQLQKYANVKQYSPVQKKDIVVNDPERFLREHIILGDSGDGVPNFLSDDDTLITPGKRQTPISKRKLAEWTQLEPEKYCTDKMLRGYRRNEAMVSLDKIPESIMQKIIDAYNNTPVAPRNKLMEYFMNKRLKNLMEVLDEF
jgi:hypothetical protein